MADRIKGITIEIGGDTTGLNKALSGVNKEIRNTQSQLKDVERLLKLDPTNTELLSQRQKLLAEAVGETKDKLETLKEAEKQAQEQFRQGKISEEQYDALKREIADTEQKLKSLEGQAERSNATMLQISAVGEKFQEAGAKIEGAGKKLLPVTAAVTGIGAAAIKTAADFDSGMSKVAAVSGASQEDMEKLRAKAREMGEQTKFSASEAADAMNYMAMAGWDAGQMMDGIEGIMSLAAADGLDLATTSDIVTDALTAFGYQASDAGHFADVLAAASSSANTNVSMLGESFKYVAPLAGTLGFSAEDVGIALGLMANSGIKASQAGTTLRSALTRLAKPTKEMGVVMDEFGISMFNSDGTAKSLADIMDMLRSEISGCDEDVQAYVASTLFGQEAMSGMLAIVNASESDYKKLSKAINNCDGTSKKMADTMQDNLNGQLTILKSQLEELAISVGEVLMPIIRDIVKAIQGWVDKLNRLTPEQKKMAVTVGLVVAALGPLLITIGKVATGIGSLIKAVSLLSPLLGALAGPAGPILLTVAAFGWLITAMSNSRDTADEYRDAVSKLTPEEEKNRDMIDSLYQSYQNLESQRAAAVQSISAQASQEQALFRELQSLTDANGKVKEGYEERASFILGQLSEALGTEYTMTGNQIQNYKDMCDSIDDLIMKKQANALLSANEAAYTEALMHQTDAYMSYNDAKKNVEDTTWAMLKAQEQEAYAADQIRQLWEENIKTGADVTEASAEWSRKQQEAAGTAQGLSEKLEGLNTDLSEAESAYVGFNTAIQNYEGLSSAIISGEQAGIEEAVLKITNNFQTSETATRESLQRQNEDLKAKYAEMKAAVEAGAPGITQAQVDAMGRLVSESEKELSKLPESGRKTGNDFGAGYSAGMREKTQDVIAAGTELATESVRSMREALDSHSPSGVTEGIGKDFDDGYAGGITKNKGGVKSAASAMAEDSMAPLRELPAQGRIWAADFMDGYISTMRGKIGELASACEEVAGTVSSYLHFTRPDVGPLREYEEWMPHMMQGLSKGIQKNQHLVTDQIIGLTRNMSTALTATDSVRSQATDLSKIESLLGYYLPEMGGASIVLDDGTLVGKILPKVNSGLAADKGVRRRNG